MEKEIIFYEKIVWNFFIFLILSCSQSRFVPCGSGSDWHSNLIQRLHNDWIFPNNVIISIDSSSVIEYGGCEVRYRKRLWK